MTTIYEILNNLGVSPEIIEEYAGGINTHIGSKKVTYYSYGNKGRSGGGSFTMFDPDGQMELLEKSECTQMVGHSFEYLYEGTNFASVRWSWSEPDGSRIGLDLFIPETKSNEIQFRSKKRGPVCIEVPKKLISKWAKESCEKEGRDLENWKRYGRIVQKVNHKALVFSAYQFAKKYKNKVGLIHDIWGHYYQDCNSNNCYNGESILIKDGNVEFVNVGTTRPETLLPIYGIDEYYEIYANF